MMNRFSLVGILLFSAFSLAACGDDDDGAGADCSTFTACGGNIQGEWTIDGLCGSEEIPVDNCPEGTITQSTDISGTITFTADGIYAAASQVHITATVTYPASCLSEEITSCDQLAGGSPDVTCTGTVTTSCSCTGSNDSSDSETGTYHTSGSVATITTEDTTLLDFCVDGNSLRAREQGTTGYVQLHK